MLLTGYQEELSRPTCYNTFQPLHCIAHKSKPHILEIYKLLPKTNCRMCRQPTCMMFASLTTEGITGSGDCPEMTENSVNRLQEYLCRFRFE